MFDLEIIAVKELQKRQGLDWPDNQEQFWSELSEQQALVNKEITKHLTINSLYTFANQIDLMANRYDSDPRNHIWPNRNIRPDRGIYLGYQEKTKQHRFLVIQGGNHFFIEVFLWSEKIWQTIKHRINQFNTLSLVTINSENSEMLAQAKSA